MPTKRWEVWRVVSDDGGVQTEEKIASYTDEEKANTRATNLNKKNKDMSTEVRTIIVSDELPEDEQ